MAKKKTAKPSGKKAAGAKQAKPPASSGTPAPLDPVQAALARRRAAMLRR
jgi:hypothetical protein